MGLGAAPTKNAQVLLKEEEQGSLQTFMLPLKKD